MENFRREIEELILTAGERGASDLHIATGHYPTLRIDGSLVPLSDRPLIDPERAEGLSYALLDEEKKQRFLKEKELDFGFSFQDKLRLRANVYYQKGYVGSAFRFISSRIRTAEELGLPAILHEFTRPAQGFVLITGPTGHGKSTTLAALIDEINHTRAEHIITIEDPIEYIFTPDKAIVDQREVGFDTLSFARALRATFRQDADVIMLGEMRDRETISTAVTAAETGHLVFATLHTNSASQTIDRIIDSFPADQQSQIRMQVASTLLGIVSQRLLPRVGGGLIPAVEVMAASYAVRNLIRENKAHQLDLMIETGSEKGMVSLNKSLAALVRQGVVALENAELYSLNVAELRALLSR
jgi:twitching motility protein PilT